MREYTKTFETIIRKDNPEIMVDKLSIIDLVFNSKTLQPDEFTQKLIETRIATQVPNL